MKRKYFFLNKENIFFIVCIIISLFVFSSSSSPQLIYVQKNIFSFIKWISYPKQLLDDVATLKTENIKLYQKLTNYKIENSKLLNFQYENIELKRILDFKDEVSFKIIPGRIINHNLNTSSTIISAMVDKGKRVGVIKRLPVITLDGLLGKVMQANDNTSSLQLIMDSNFRISVNIGSEKRQLAIFKPTHGKYGILEGVLKTTKIKKNEIIYTSGISDVYPRNIPVAKVVDFFNDKNDTFQNVIVEILVDINNLDYVLIVK